jgi:hypothetical protein
MLEVLFVTDFWTAANNDPYGWDMTNLHEEMLNRAIKEGWPGGVFDRIVVKEGEFLTDALMTKAGAAPQIMEIQLHGYRNEEMGISFLMTNWEDMDCSHMDFCVGVIESGIRAGKIILRVCGVKASDYNNYDYDGRRIRVEIGKQGIEYPSQPILNPADKEGTGATIWEYYGRRYFPNHMEVGDLILGPVR